VRERFQCILMGSLDAVELVSVFVKSRYLCVQTQMNNHISVYLTYREFIPRRDWGIRPCTSFERSIPRFNKY
jgi:hypothetical protein